MRWGLLGKGAVLMAAAYPNRTSPVLRGAFILKHIQGVPPANPPPNVPTLDEKDIGTTKALTVREMMAKHRASPTCSSCHAVMDPLGLALENFDATGMWRDRDRYAGAAIDSSGELPDGTPVKGPDDLRKALLRQSRAVRADVHRGLADLRDRAQTGVLRHADRAADRARRGQQAITGSRRWSRRSVAASSSGCAGCRSRRRRRK